VKAPSQDVRERVLPTVDQGYARAEIVQLFGISFSPFKRYLKQRREERHVQPKAIPGRPSKKRALVEACRAIGARTLFLSMLSGAMWPHFQGQSCTSALAETLVDVLIPSRVRQYYQNSIWCPQPLPFIKSERTDLKSQTGWD
jgi:hypothetical protein